MSTLTYEEAAELLDYDAATGALTWKVKKGRGLPGARAGWLTRQGYERVGVDRRFYLSHRLAWLLSYGKWPDHQLDHIDGNKNNNRLSNLREASPSENQRNAALRRDNSSGIKNVSRHSKTGKWQARVFAEGKSYYLGVFDDLAEAAAAASSGRQQIHGDFCRHF